MAAVKKLVSSPHETPPEQAHRARSISTETRRSPPPASHLPDSSSFPPLSAARKLLRPRRGRTGAVRSERRQRLTWFNGSADNRSYGRIEQARNTAGHDDGGGSRGYFRGRSQGARLLRHRRPPARDPPPLGAAADCRERALVAQSSPWNPGKRIHRPAADRRGSTPRLIV